jgi:hypothetical protein
MQWAIGRLFIAVYRPWMISYRYEIAGNKRPLSIACCQLFAERVSLTKHFGIYR